MNNLIDLLNYGQSYWLDNLTRKKITGGELKKRVTQSGLRGITSNPSIFNKAISNSSDYDKQILQLVKDGRTPAEIYEALTVKDVQDACDILKPVFQSSGGKDGFVSLEVSPYLARDTDATISEARRLSKLVNKPNCYIKIPGTAAGIPAIEQMVYEGVPINITLLFSVERYKEIAECYIRAIRRREEEDLPIKNIVSVASFFLSRIDVLVDSILSQYLLSNSSQVQEVTSLMGKAGIASAKIAYLEMKKLFASDAWKDLEEKGANVQRLLWASTSTKDPMYDDLYYVESLIGPDTVNTLPDETIDALANHGMLSKNTISSDTSEAEHLFERLKKLEIDMDAVTRQLEIEGVQKFIESYDELISNIASKRKKILGRTFSEQTISPGNLKKQLTSTYDSLQERNVVRRMYNKDAYLWKGDEADIKVTGNRLGWLELPGNTDEIEKFVEQVQRGGFKYAVLLGMGGSSLCSEVARQTFKVKQGYLKLFVLDNTSPEAISDLENQIDLDKTIFIAASKSGSTLETISFFRFFYERLKKKGVADPGNNFTAITDAGTPLVEMANEYNFRKIFINRGDIGGRYSVLSHFGLLPMALMGIDIRALLANAALMKKNCSPEIPVVDNPAISLGAALGIAQKNGRDKVTFILSPSISAFGFWVEQLLAESTGKEGKGLIPVTGEELDSPRDYQDDRIFIYIKVKGEKNLPTEKKLSLLEHSGHPVVRIDLPDKLSLGGEYYRWELATAISGMLIGINPFNEPNVAEGKKNTNDLLAAWKKNKKFEKPQVYAAAKGFNLYLGEEVKKITGDKKLPLASLLKKFKMLANEKNYFALLCYFEETPQRTKLMEACRVKIKKDTKSATTLNYGPRYLHSTGQLHKGGPGSGLYVVLASDNQDNMRIPGKQFSFGTLHEAQSWGDFKSLADKHRRIIYIEICGGIEKVLKEFKSAL
jgi:transaldolase/glucose-6-phosphate isomerase